ncbi:MAG: hypothetical protein HDS65_10270 [Bacteroidales bacterium]|nr:hypothetical protein [Bacteroidales bacterium]
MAKVVDTVNRAMPSRHSRAFGNDIMLLSGNVIVGVFKGNERLLDDFDAANLANIC